jgi:hypothetical protein
MRDLSITRSEVARYTANSEVAEQELLPFNASTGSIGEFARWDRTGGKELAWWWSTTTGRNNEEE